MYGVWEIFVKIQKHFNNLWIYFGSKYLGWEPVAQATFIGYFLSLYLAPVLYEDIKQEEKVST